MATERTPLASAADSFWTMRPDPSLHDAPGHRPESIRITTGGCSPCSAPTGTRAMVSPGHFTFNPTAAGMPSKPEHPGRESDVIRATRLPHVGANGGRLAGQLSVFVRSAIHCEPRCVKQILPSGLKFRTPDAETLSNSTLVPRRGLPGERPNDDGQLDGHRCPDRHAADDHGADGSHRLRPSPAGRAAVRRA